MDIHKEEMRGEGKESRRNESRLERAREREMNRHVLVGSLPGVKCEMVEI